MSDGKIKYKAFLFYSPVVLLPVFSVQQGHRAFWCGSFHLAEPLQSQRRSSSVWQLQVSPLQLHQQLLRQLHPPLSYTSSISSGLGLLTFLGLCSLPGPAQRRAHTSRPEPWLGTKPAHGGSVCRQLEDGPPWYHDFACVGDETAWSHPHQAVWWRELLLEPCGGRVAVCFFPLTERPLSDIMFF